MTPITAVSFLFLHVALPWAGGFPAETKESYEGHHIFDVVPENENHKNLLSRLIDDHELDVWRYPKSYGETMSVRVRPEWVGSLVKTLNKHGLHFRIQVRDLQILVDEQLRSISESRQKRASGYTLMNYNRHSEINHFLDKLAEECSRCSVQTIGKSHEDRDLKVFTISSGKPDQPAIFIDGGMHAREWISPATVVNLLYFIAKTPSLQYLVDWFDWHFLPVANPDGYEYTKHKRMWRKTRKPNGRCWGTDPNRNFDYKWGERGASDNPCSETYRGTKPFSEPETRSIQDFILSQNGTIEAYLTFHSYGQYFVYPWGFEGCDGDAAVDTDLKELAIEASTAIINADGGLRSNYTVGTSGCALYPAAGGSDDWAKGVAGIKYAYTVELPDTGIYGFLLPRKKIAPVAAETLKGLEAFATLLHKRINAR